MTGTTLRNAGLVLPEGSTQGALHIVGEHVAASANGLPEVDLSGDLVLPGLVNAHDHLHLNNVPGLTRRDPFPNSYAWAEAFEGHFRVPEVIAALAVPERDRCWQGGLKNILSGATTVAHHDPWRASLDEPGFPTGLLRRSGWCHSLGLAPEDWGWLRRALARLLADKNRGSFGPPVRASFAATPRDAPWIIHLAEGTDDEARGELGRLASLGCLAQNTVIVHGVGLGEADVAAIIERKAAVVWCPGSNLQILGATLSPRRLFDAGRLAIGTDSRLSGSRDLLDELRIAARESSLSPADLLRLATVDGARALRMPEVGGLAPGQRADLVVIRHAGVEPGAALLSQSRSDLRAVVRSGKPVIADPDLADWFTIAEVPAVRVALDGRPKVMAASLARDPALAIEPGLERQPS